MSTRIIKDKKAAANAPPV